MRQSFIYCCLAACALCPTVRAASSAELKVQLGHSFFIYSVAFSPDGRSVLTGSQDKTARLWNVDSGREIRRFQGDTDGVTSVAFSPDGRSVLTGSVDKSVRLWDVATGREVRRFEGHSSYVYSVAFSPDGRSILTGSHDQTVRLWDVATGREIRRFEGHTAPVQSVTFSRDGASVLTGSLDQTARLWDVATGREIHRFEVHTIVDSVDLSPDGRSILTGSSNKGARLWDVATGRQMLDFPVNDVRSVAFSPDGRSVLTGCWLVPTRLWDAATGKEIRRFESGSVLSVAFAPDGRSVVTAAGWDPVARLWDVATANEIRRFEGHSASVNAVAFAPDGRSVVTGNEDNTARLWDAASGNEVRRFEGHSREVTSVAFSPDGRSVLTGSHDGTARLWEAATGREIRRIVGHPNSEVGTTDATSVAFSPDGRSVLTQFVRAARLFDAATGTEIRSFEAPRQGMSLGLIASLAFSPDGRSIVTGNDGNTARVWDVATGREVRRLEIHNEFVHSVAFSPDGRSVLTGSYVPFHDGQDETAQLWNVATGRETRSFKGHSGWVMSAAFSPDGRSVLTGGTDNTARLWDTATGREIRRFEGHSFSVSSVAFSHDGRYVATGSFDGTSKIWDRASGRLLATLVGFKDGGWAVIDSNGRYDASDPDNLPGLYWQLGDEIIELKQLKDRFYAPNLLSRTLGFSTEPLPRVAGLSDLQLSPAVQVNPPAAGQSVATIRLADRGGGIGRIVVKVNGREIPKAIGGAPIRADTSIPLNLSAAQLAAGRDNTLEVIPYGKDNLVAGRGVKVVWKQSPEKASAPPVLHAIVAGVSNYENPSMSLKYPAKDALDMAHALELGGKRMFGVNRIDIAVFASGASHEPTKEAIRTAFEAIPAKAGPNDVVLVYLAGHGVAGQAGSDLYYYLTRDTRSTNPQDDPQLWEQTTISSAELLEWLRRKGMPLRQVVVLDTCAAGAATTELLKLADRRDLTADQRRALELLKDATGSHILMGAAADKVSYEANRYGQGLLTYSLLLGMRGEALDEGGRLDVTKWFKTAESRVPQLAQGIGGIQRPVISSPGGETFPFALFTPEDVRQIRLPILKPQLLRARVEDEDQNDPLQLDEPVRSELRAASTPATRGETSPEPPLVYLDQVAGDVADAYVPQVRYQVNRNAVQIRLRLVSTKDRLEVTFAASTRDPAELARRIVDEFVKMLAGLKQK